MLQIVLVLPDLHGLDMRYGEMMEHIESLKKLGAEIVVSTAGMGGPLEDSLTERGIECSRTYTDISIERPGTVRCSQPLASSFKM